MQRPRNVVGKKGLTTRECGWRRDRARPVTSATPPEEGLTEAPASSAPRTPADHASVVLAVSHERELYK